MPLTQEEIQAQPDNADTTLGLLHAAGYLTITGRERLPGVEGEDSPELFKCRFPNPEIAVQACTEIRDYLREQIGVTNSALAPARQVLVAALEQGDMPQVCAQLNELIAGVNFPAFHRIDREFYRRLLLLWLQDWESKIEVYTPDDQWLAALRLRTRSGRCYQLELYCLETIEPYKVGDKAARLTYGRLEAGIKLYPAQTREVESYRRNHVGGATSEFSRVGLLFDHLHHVVAWSDIDHDGAFYHLVKKFNPFD